MKTAASIIISQLRGYQLVIHCALFITHYTFINAQPPTQPQLTGTYIGLHTEWDTDVFCPLPTYLRLAADGAYTLGLVDGSVAPIRSTWGVRGDTVRLDTIHYAPKLVALQGDLLRIGVYYPMIFRRFLDIPVDSVSMHRQLTSRVWQSDSLIVSLYANGRVSLENPVTKQRTAHFWRLARFGNSLFLVVQGNQYSRDSGYKPLWQIVSTTPKQLLAIGWNGREVATETFRLVRTLPPGDSCQPSGFQPCDNCFTRLWYDTPASRSSGRYELTQLFAKHYKPVEQAGQSGLIRIRFVVNCQGQRGMFEVTGFDHDYCPQTFDAQITSQLLAICHEHVPADLSIHVSDQPDTYPQDKAISLAFRLKDGYLTDILP